MPTICGREDHTELLSPTSVSNEADVVWLRVHNESLPATGKP